MLPADRTALARGGVGRVGGGDGLLEIEEGVQLVPPLPNCGHEGDGVEWKRLEIWKAGPAPPLDATNLNPPPPWDREQRTPPIPGGLTLLFVFVI